MREMKVYREKSRTKFPYLVSTRLGIKSVDISRHGTFERAEKVFNRESKKRNNSTIKGNVILWLDHPSKNIDILRKVEFGYKD